MFPGTFIHREHLFMENIYSWHVSMNKCSQEHLFMRTFIYTTHTPKKKIRCKYRILFDNFFSFTEVHCSVFIPYTTNTPVTFTGFFFVNFYFYIFLEPSHG